MQCAARLTETEHTIRMANELVETECCAVCGEEAEGAHAYCHFYPEGQRVTMCSPECAEKFLRGPGHDANGHDHRGLIEGLVDERRWTYWR